MSGTDIFSDVNLLFWLCRVYGFASFQVSRSEFGKKQLRHRNCHYFVCTMFQIIYVICTFFDTYKFWARQTNVDLSIILRTLQVCINTAFCIASCICSKVHHKRNQKFWQNLYNVERSLKKFDITLNHKLLKRVSYIYVAGAIAITSFSTIPAALDAYNSGSILEYTKCVCYHYYSVATSILIAQHTLPYAVITSFLKGLENTAEVTLLRCRYNNVPKHSEILEIARYHRLIHKSARSWNRVISVPLLFHIMGIFFLLAASSFATTLSLIYNVYDFRDIILGIWISIALISLIAMVIVSHKYVERVSNIGEFFV